MRCIIFAVILVFFLNHNSFGQANNGLYHRMILSEGFQDSLYVFGKWDPNGGTETRLKYLGNLNTLKGVYKIITSSWIWGLSKRATNRMLVFNNNDDYLGNYKLTMICDLPEKIEKNKVIFQKSGCRNCDKSVRTEISFEEGIPKNFFIECANNYGDIYAFSSEK